MATNIVYETRAAVRLAIDFGASVSSGDVEFLNDLGFLVLEDSDSNDVATAELIGIQTVVDLSVTGEDDAGNSAVSVGETIYKDGTAYNKDAVNGTKVGYALEAVGSGSTATIQVALAL